MPTKLLKTKTAIFSFSGLRGLWSECVGCLWMQLFMAVPVTPSAAVSDFGGRRYHRFVPFNFLLSLAAHHLHGVLVLVTVNLSPVLLSPAIIVHRWEIYRRYQRHRRSLKIRDKDYSPVSLTPVNSLSPVINIHSRNGPNGILGGWGDNDLSKKPEVENLVSDSL